MLDPSLSTLFTHSKRCRSLFSDCDFLFLHVQYISCRFALVAYFGVVFISNPMIMISIYWSLFWIQAWALIGKYHEIWRNWNFNKRQTIENSVLKLITTTAKQQTHFLLSERRKQIELCGIVKVCSAKTVLARVVGNGLFLNCLDHRKLMNWA